MASTALIATAAVAPPTPVVPPSIRTPTATATAIAHSGMHIWEMEAYPCGDMRLPHHLFPPKYIAQTQLTELAGVYLYKVDLDDTMATKKRLTRVREQWNVSGADVLTLDKKLGDLDLKLAQMYEPMESDDDNVCLVLDGEMYYDVEFEDEKWLRVHLRRGDLIVVPKGCYYRSTVTPSNYVKLQRFKQLPQTVNG